MAKVLLRRQALELRKFGKSYGQIKDELGVSKSTLSSWLRQLPLTKEQLRLLNHASENRIEKYKKTMRSKREAKLLEYYNQAKKDLLPLSKRELFLAGLFLYWGEGGKTEKGMVSISNTDPGVLKFSLLWMRQALDVPKNKIHVLLHLYEDMIVEDAISYWSKSLKLSKTQFTKPYIKKSKKTSIDYKGFGQGTCMLRVFNTDLKTKVLMSIKAVTNYSEEHISGI